MLAALCVVQAAFAAPAAPPGQALGAPERAGEAPTTRPTNHRLEAVRRKAAARRLEQELTTAWHRRIEGLVRRFLSREAPTARREGLRQLAAIRDPLALQPLIRVLGGSPLPQVRIALAEHLGRFARDDAVLQLTVMCLTDPDAAVRAAAVAQLSHQDDPRLMELLRGALHSRHEAFVLFAAEAVRALERLEAADALIDALVATGAPGVAGVKATRAFLGRWKTTWKYSIRPQTAPGAALPAETGLADATRWLHRARPGTAEPHVVEPSVFRTAVLEALRALTNEDFGFDQRRWRQWWNHERKRRKLLPKLND